MKPALPERVKILIIGAGPTGLGAAHRLTEHGERDFLILDANDRVGGLATSYVDARGFTWDVGGHVVFSHYDYFDRVLDAALPPDGWIEHQRAAYVRIGDRFVPYPFQNNLHHLPDDVAWRCLEGMLSAHEAVGSTPGNLHEWILGSFGHGVADVFLLPYNYKVWAYPPAWLGHGWVSERVSRPRFRDVLATFVLRRDDASFGPNNTFRFPVRGGTGAIWDGVADRIGRDHVRLGARIVRISARERTATLADGRSIRFDQLLSTLPVACLTEIVEEIPSPLRRRASALLHSSTHVVGVGMRGRPPEPLLGKSWLYFPESNCPFYRATLFSQYSPENAPDGHWSLLTETSASPEKPVDGSRLARDTLDGLVATGIVNALDDVVSVWDHRVEYGYPTPSLKRDAILGEVMPQLESLGVYSRGRFGAWRYEVSNQDHSLMQGVEWVDRLLKGATETTVHASS